MLYRLKTYNLFLPILLRSKIHGEQLVLEVNTKLISSRVLSEIGKIKL